MNPQSQLIELPPHTSAPAPEGIPATDNSQASRSPVSGRRRNGKIAGLPKAIRDQINPMIQDGFSYRAIIEKLNAPGAPPLPYPITEHHLSEWKDGGYEDWVQQQLWQHEMRAERETFSGLLSGSDPIQLPEGGLQIATTGICQLLRDLSLSRSAPGADPDKYLRAANSLARLSRSILHLQLYRDACAKAREALKPLKDPKRKLSDEERRSIVLEVDDILGISHDNPDVYGIAKYAPNPLEQRNECRGRSDEGPDPSDEGRVPGDENPSSSSSSSSSLPANPPPPPNGTINPTIH